MHLTAHCPLFVSRFTQIDMLYYRLHIFYVTDLPTIVSYSKSNNHFFILFMLFDFNQSSLSIRIFRESDDFANINSLVLKDFCQSMRD
jgi:hypothetical protein